MGLLQKIKESKAAQYATGALIGLGIAGATQANTLSDKEINKQALLQSQSQTQYVAQTDTTEENTVRPDTTEQNVTQPDTTEEALPSADLVGQERLDEICNIYCQDQAQEAAQQTYNIFAGETSSKEALVNGEYNIPFTTGTDTLNISNLVNIREGTQAYLQVNTDEGTQTYNLDDLTTEHKISTANNAQFERGEGDLEGDLIYTTTEQTRPGSQSYAISTDEDAVRLIIGHAQSPEMLQQYKEDLGRLLDQNQDLRMENSTLENNITLYRERAQETQRTLDTTRAQRDQAQEKQEITEDLLNGWGISAGAGTEYSTNGVLNPQVSLGADFPLSTNTSGNISLIYGAGGETALPTTTDRTSETVPRGPLEGAENVRETTKEETLQLNNSIGGGLSLPVNQKISLEVEGGVKYFSLTTNTTDQSYTTQDGERFNQQQDTQQTTTSTTAPYMGVNATYNITDNVSVEAGGNMTFSSGDIEETNSYGGKIGVTYTIR